MGRLGMAGAGWGWLGMAGAKVGEGRGWRGWLIRAHISTYKKLTSTYGKFQPGWGWLGMGGISEGWYAQV